MPPSTSHPQGMARRSGFTIVELIVTMAIVVVAAGILARTLAGTSGMRSVNRENSLAIEGGRQVLEQIRDLEFSEVFALYNEDPEDDPGGPGTAPGPRFAVAGLEPLEGSGGMHGEVTLPAILTDVVVEEQGEQVLLMPGEKPPEPETVKVWQIREDYVDTSLGMPRDLNGDNVIDSEDHSKDYIILPVCVNVSWDGRGAKRSTELHTMFTKFNKKF